MTAKILFFIALLVPGLVVEFPPPKGGSLSSGRGGRTVPGLEGPLLLRAAAAFRPEELPRTSGLALFDWKGNPLAADFLTTARWEDGSVRLLAVLAALPARSAAGRVRLVSGSPAPPPKRILSMAAKGDCVTVDSGPLEMTFDAGSPRFITGARFEGKEIPSLGEGVSFYLSLEGRLYRPRRSLLLLSRGRARGKVLFSGRLFDGLGAAGPAYSAGFAFLAGSARVECRIALAGGLFRGNDAGVYLRLNPPWRIPAAPVKIIAGGKEGILAPKGGGGAALISGPGLVEASSGRKSLSFLSSGDAGILLAGCSPRLGLSFPLFGRLHPWGVSVRRGGSLTISLLNEGFSWEPFFTFERRFGFAFSRRGSFGAGGPKRPEQASFRLPSDPRRRLFPFAGGGTLKSGGGLAKSFLRVTSAMERRLRGEWKSWDGFRNYGDSRKAWGEWANEEYDPVFGLVKRFLWSGDPRDFEMARVILRHWLRYDRAGREDPKAPEGTFWMHGKSHRSGRFEAGHVWVDGLLLYYAMTGDEESLDAARRAGRLLESGLCRLGTAKLERSVSWPLVALTALVEAGEDRFRPAMDRVADLLRSRLTAKGIPLFRETLSKEEECYEVNTWVTAGITVEALYRHFRVTGDERSFACAVKAARAVLQGGLDPGEGVLRQRIFVSKRTGEVLARDGVVTGGKLALCALGAARAFELSGEDLFRESGRAMMSRALGRLTACPPRRPGEDLTLLLRVGLDGIEALEGEGKSR